MAKGAEHCCMDVHLGVLLLANSGPQAKQAVLCRLRGLSPRTTP